MSGELRESPLEVTHHGEYVEQGGQGGEALHNISHGLSLDGMGDEDQCGGQRDPRRCRGRPLCLPSLQEWRGLEQQYYEKIDQEPVGDVDEEVNQVIAEDIETPEVVVQGKGEEADITELGKIKQIYQILDPRIFHDAGGIIKMKGRGECVRVDKGSKEGKKKKGWERSRQELVPLKVKVRVGCRRRAFVKVRALFVLDDLVHIGSISNGCGGVKQRGQ